MGNGNAICWMKSGGCFLFYQKTNQLTIITIFKPNNSGFTVKERKTKTNILICKEIQTNKINNKPKQKRLLK